MQIRIYYEVLEQALHFIKPIVDDALRGIQCDIQVLLIRRPDSFRRYNSGVLSAISDLTTPDVLLTGVKDDGEEVPLFIIELSEAVLTEDHELQRTNGAIAAYFANALYIKISGDKISNKEFGGAPYNPYLSPKILLDAFNYDGYIIAKWETEPSNPNNLLHNITYPSCPPKISILSKAITIGIQCFVNDFQTWYSESLKQIKVEKDYIDYRKNVLSAGDLNQLVDSWKTRFDSDLSKQRYSISSDSVTIKMNRFAHGLDPDRGILVFCSFMFSDKYKIYVKYAIRRTRDPLKVDIDSIDTMKRQAKIALKKDYDDPSGGISPWLQKIFEDAIDKSSALTDQIDVTDVLLKEKHIKDATKADIAIVYCSDGLKIDSNGILIYWDRSKLLGLKDSKFADAFSSKFGFLSKSTATTLRRVVSSVDEDEVTYALVHRVLSPNGFKIASVSYPGAQGSAAVLPKPEAGKSQTREYIDVVAIPPEVSPLDVLLNESKGKFSQKVDNDRKKLLVNIKK